VEKRGVKLPTSLNLKFKSVLKDELGIRLPVPFPLNKLEVKVDVL
jgi:hypothetical protein